MSVDILCMGEPMLEFNQLPPTAEGKPLYLQGFGGDTSNTAIAAARQGARVGYITAIGADWGGDAFLELWQEEGIDTSTVIRRPHLPTAVYFVMHHGAHHSFLFYRSGSAAASYGPGDLPAEVIGRSRIFYASGISQAISDSAADAVFGAIDIVRQSGGTVAYDTNYRSALWPPARASAVIHAAAARAQYLFVSEEDAEALTARSHPDAILDFYMALGPSLVVLKLGHRGAMLATPESRIHVRPPDVVAIDSTGAGDVLSGAFLARVLAGASPENALRYAVVAASLKTRGYGAVAPIPRQQEVTRTIGAET